MLVKVYDNDISKALRVFKRKVQEEGIIKEYRDRREYTKPSIKRRQKHAAAVRREAKKRQKQQW